MTVQEALQNIHTVVSNFPMKHSEHHVLQQSVELVVQRCQLADKLENKNGSTDKQPKLSRVDQKDSE